MYLIFLYIKTISVFFCSNKISFLLWIHSNAFFSGRIVVGIEEFLSYIHNGVRFLVFRSVYFFVLGEFSFTLFCFIYLLLLWLFLYFTSYYKYFFKIFFRYISYFFFCIFFIIRCRS